MSGRRFQRVLVANRGEIAVRILQALRTMGIASLAICSEADRGALHTQWADEVALLPGVSARDTYLHAEAILAIAQAHGADALHPGYGFLAENAGFAEACARAGIAFIGPSVAVLRMMGDKIEAKARMEAAGVPTIPGWQGDANASPGEVQDQAERIGYPVLVKAAAGGGGKGMRRVASSDALLSAWQAAAREAHGAFGDARVFLEACLDGARHVEVQIFGDARGQVMHLFERDCSIQRRHQKIIEESPCPAMSPATRQRLTQAAVRAAQAIGYQGAGTVEFLWQPPDTFYFLEVNARLQVEHPVSESVTGVDLVQAQILTAQGEPVPFSQQSLQARGHAIECRLCAEDPANGFLPATGPLLRLRWPHMPGVRVDSGVQQGDRITPHYDSLLAKIIATGSDRAQALARMRAALDACVILGVTTNLPLLQTILADAAFARGEYHTGLLAQRPDWLCPVPDPQALALAAVLAADPQNVPITRQTHTPPALVDGSPWRDRRGWRLGTGVFGGSQEARPHE